MTSQSTDAPVTVPVKPQHSFDVERLSAYLRASMPGFQGALRVQQFEGGQSNPTFLLETPGHSYVLRRKPPGELARSAHAVDREYRVLAALWATGFAVPRPHVLCEDESVLGTMFFVMDHVPGRIIRDPTMPELSPPERHALVLDYVDTLARLHSIDYKAVGLEDFGRPGNYFERQISRWGRQYQETETDPIPEMHQLLDWLQRSVPDQQATGIVHGDYQFGNVLTHPTEPRVAAVLDWELSTIGDPLADFTYFTGPWHAPAGERSLGGIDLEAHGIPSYQDLLERYCQKTGRPGIEHPEFYRAFHAFRSGAILQGIIRRAIQGNNAGEMAFSFSPDDVRSLARRGLTYTG